MNTNTAGPTRALARHIVGYAAGELDTDAQTIARQCILDWFAVTLPGVHEPAARILIDEFRDTSRGPCRIAGEALSFAPMDAALVNGTASHALDYDDVNARMSGHPTVAILPAALAVAQLEKRSGAEVLRAFIAGYETAANIGALLAPSHYLLGFHATGTIGAFGAAAAAGLLMRLDEEQICVALSLAATQAAGLKSMFGTMVKPFHAGKAAANGVLAARLAARGFSAPLDALETAQGFIATQSREQRPETIQLPPRGSEMRNNLFKYHAACYLTHSVIEAVHMLRETEGLEPGAVEHIELHVPASHLDVCNIEEPKTGLETKFSLRHTAALALAGKDTAAIGTYSNELACDPALVALRHITAVIPDIEPGMVSRAVIRLKSGRTVEKQHDTALPDNNLHRQQERLTAKFHSLADPFLGESQAATLAGAIGKIQDMPTIDGLMHSYAARGKNQHV
ncbi:MAG: MmgE/PrpD family protein [Parvibaculum sp.]|nr:MmgE/PrpD family protein [Parvibaculum sp.]